MFDFITGLIGGAGYLGVMLLMFAENVFPPIPSELIMPLAGFTAAQGQLDIWLVILAGTVGSVAGAWLWYEFGRRVGMRRICELADRHGRWLTMSTDDVSRAKGWFDRHGWVAVFTGRLVPAIRTLISVPAGIARMPRLPFLFYSTIGSLLWTALLAGAGYLLQSQYTLIEAWLDPVSTAVLVLMVGWYLYRVVTWEQPSGEPRPERPPAG